MELVFTILVVSTAIELLIYKELFWRLRRSTGLIVLAIALLATIVVMLSMSLLPALAFCVVSDYRLFNIYRASKGLVSSKRLKPTAFKSSLWLNFIVYSVMASYYFWPVSLAKNTLEVTISLLLLGVACVLSLALRLSLKRMKLPVLLENHAKRDLPAVTVAIPARNETTDLEECLKTLVASTYQKLEIIVLDDCSQNRRTPEIIRQFAHDGVKFMAGAIPPVPWLAKNYAYEQLLNAANGEYIMFCGVDARFEPRAITKFVESLIQTDKSMISLMPVNKVSTGRLLPYLIQPVRYAWEILLPRKWNKRPPVLSTCWIASADFMRSMGGFSAVTQAILPERSFARQALKHAKYGFYKNDSSVGFTSVKSGPDQLSTAIRTRYPQLHRAPENVLFIALIEVSLAILPLVFVVHGVIDHSYNLVLINGLSILIMTALYAVIDRTTYSSFKLLSLIAMPFALIYDAVILHISMWRYEFSEVLWKGRNICLPLLQTIPYLPKLPDNK